MPLEPLSLRAGPLTVLSDNGDLRYVRLGEREILRRVFFAVRDHNWGTAHNDFGAPHLEQGADWFNLTFDAVSRLHAIEFAWTGRISGAADGTLTFGFDGVARSTFRRNRLGLLVLHPGQACAGAPVRVTQADGRVIETAFPDDLAPVPPFTDIAALSYALEPGLWATVRFTGEVFETEDQRNWTDASFKTYSTPTRLPMPVEVPAGTRITQSIALTLEGALPATITTPVERPAILTVGADSVGVLPPLGVGAASHGQMLDSAALDQLRALRLSHLRVDVRLTEADWPAALRRAASEAAALDLPLEAALHLPAEPAPALAQLAAELGALGPRVARWLVYSQGQPSTSAAALTAARQQLTGAPIIGGSDAYFAQLNQARPPIALLDGVCYSINPQGHAFDTRSMMETFEAQAATVRSGRHFAAGKPIVVSPVTLRPRFNPAATGPEPPPAPGELPPQVDLRQMQAAGAAWTVGSLAALAEAGAASLTYYETTGWRGLIEIAAGSPDPAAFPSAPGQLFPLYHVFAALAAWRGAQVLPVTVSQPLQTAGLALRQGQAHTALVANLTDRPSQVRLLGVAPAAALRPVVDQSSAADGAEGALELSLGPYAVAQLTW